MILEQAIRFVHRGGTLALVLVGLIPSVSVCWAQEQRTEARKLDDETRMACVTWLQHSGLEPEQYVASKFAQYDLVMLGETHEVKENCEFVAALVAPLYKVGVRTLCSEFVCSRYNDQLVRIVTAQEYDEAGVVDMFRKGPWPTWGYKDYMDIVRAIWAFNRTLSTGAEPFRIIGIDSDWKQFDLLTKAAAEKQKIVLAREVHMDAVIRCEVFDKKIKALVHVGFAHTARQGQRLAGTLAREHGDRMFQVCLHHEMPGVGGRRFTGFVENVIAKATGKEVGFDVAGTPWGALRDEEGMYFRMLGKNSTFQDFAGGYVFLKPIRDLKPVIWMKGFIVPDTFEQAKAVAEKLGWVEKDKYTTPAELDDALAARLAKRGKARPSGM